MRSSQIEVLSSPSDYYLALHKLIKQSTRRISMSALYLGTGKLELFLLDRISKKLTTASDLDCKILLDYMRGTREETMKGSNERASSFSLLSDLKMKHYAHDSLRIGFYHNPDTGMLKGAVFPGPYREIFGVHHIKAHVFDDNVLFTGANLTDHYFTMCQDRYFIV